MYRVYWNQSAAAYLSFRSSFFFLSQFSNNKNFRHIFLRNCESYKITLDICEQWVDVLCMPIRLLLLINPLFLHFSFSSFYAPNFEEVEGAYWFGPVCGLSVCACMRVCIRYACIRSKRVKDRILKFNMWNKHEK